MWIFYVHCSHLKWFLCFIVLFFLFPLGEDEGASLSGLPRCGPMRGGPAAEWRWDAGGFVSASAPPAGSFPPANLDSPARAADWSHTPRQTGLTRKRFCFYVYLFHFNINLCADLACFLQRTCRRLLALYDLPSWGRCELVLSLLQEPGVSYSLEDVVQAVKESHDRDFIRRLLNNECPICLSIFPRSKVGHRGERSVSAATTTRFNSYV